MADELEIDVATEFGKAEASIESLQKVEEALERMITRMVSEKEKCPEDIQRFLYSRQETIFRSIC